MDTQKADLVAQKVRDSKEATLFAPGTSAFARRIGWAKTWPPGNRHLREDDLKRLAHQAIELMGENEIRKLRIPLGVVIDALRTRQP